MITDQQLANKEREIARLFLGLRTKLHQHVEDRQVAEQIKTPSQRIERILRRAQLERKATDALPQRNGKLSTFPRQDRFETD